MDCIALLHPTPTDPEIAVVKISNKEHKAFHDNWPEFVKQLKVFGIDVSTLEPAPCAGDTSANAWLMLLAHRLDCTWQSLCVRVRV